jgi:uncharacterized membrane protein YcaP (DUF421 family)
MIGGPYGIILRAAIVYLAILFGLRIAGKRRLGQLSVPDFVLVLLVSNAVQNAMVGDDTSLGGGLIAAATLFVLNVLVTLFAFRFRFFERAVEGDAVMLVWNGRVLQRHLDSEKITFEELDGIVREHGIERLEAVHLAVLEIDGTISIVPMSNAPAVQHAKLKRFRTARRSS